MSGTPPEVLQHEELFSILLPTLKADFQLVETYEFTHNFPVQCPITVFGGDSDDEVFDYELIAWSEQTSKTFKSKIYCGGHFYIEDHLQDLVNLIVDDIQKYI